MHDTKSGLAEGYIHGFTNSGQDRLYRQARVNEKMIFSAVDFAECEHILEVGSGVGAQTQILLERYPDMKIQCVDASTAQVDRARKTLKQPILSGQIQIDVADALHMPYAPGSFDGAFICWLLEHVRTPIEILAETRRTLKPGGVIYCNEVFNSSFYVHPYSPATQKFWFEFNDHQWTLKGDPFVGGKLANYLMQAGYKNVTTQVRTHQYDNRTPKQRARFIDYWTDLLLSGSQSLLDVGRITPELVEEMKVELTKLKSAPDSVFFYSWILARAEA